MVKLASVERLLKQSVHCMLPSNSVTLNKTLKWELQFLDVENLDHYSR